MKSPESTEQKESVNNNDNNNKNGYIVLVGLLFKVTLGLLWTYGNILPYIASYVAYHNSSLPVSPSSYNHYTAIINYSFFLLFTSSSCGAVFGGKLEIYFGPKISIIISSIFILIGLGGTTFGLLINNIFCILFFYGIMFGGGIGLGYPILIIVVMRWFPNYQGRLCGLISAVFGGSPFIWDFIQEKLVNPHKYIIDDKVGFCKQKDVIDKIPYLFVYIAAIAAVMQLISVFCVKNPSWYIPEKQLKNKVENKKSEKSAQQLEYEKDSLSVPQTIRTTTFWIFWINNFIYTFVQMFMTAEWKEFAINYLQIDNDNFLSLVGSIGALFNGIGRFLWGFAYDFNKSFKILMGTQTFIVAVFIATLPLIKFIYIIDEHILFAIWMCAIWICVGCHYGFLPSCIAATFGTKNTGSIVGLFIWSDTPTSLLVVVATQYKDQLFNGWFYYMIFVGGCSFLSTILSIITRESLDRKKIIKSWSNKSNKYKIHKSDINDMNESLDDGAYYVDANNYSVNKTIDS